MQVILLETIHNLGNLGDIVSVKPGYARNYLIPNKMASRATEDNIKAFEQRKTELLAKEKETLAAAQARAESVSGLSLSIDANASPEGHLYGSVGPREIAEKLTESGFPVDPTEVILVDGVFKHVGEYSVKLMFHADVETEFKLTVDATEAEEAPEIAPES